MTNCFCLGPVTMHVCINYVTNACLYKLGANF